MKLKVLTWNLRRAGPASPVWPAIRNTDADIVLLQEVGGVPDFIKEHYSLVRRKAVRRNGCQQTFSTAVLVKGKIVKEMEWKSDLEWMNRELAFFAGNLLACTVKVKGIFPINVVSVYSPAWPVAKERLEGTDVSGVRLTQNGEVWCTEILWAALKSDSGIHEQPWIVGGDFNSSPTFDLWKGGPRGNQEIIDRMQALGFRECLRTHTGRLTPTFRNPRGGRLIHQLDHVYVTEPLLSALTNAYVTDTAHSDHLPVISEFFVEDGA